MNLRKFFTNSKKNTSTPKKWEAGDVFAIPLKDNSFAFGQVLDKENCTCVLLDMRSGSPVLSVPEFKKLRPISIMHLCKGDLLENGEWQILFRTREAFIPGDGRGGKAGTIGSRSYGECGAMKDLANAYWGLTPWNVMFDENYYDKLLLLGITRPSNVLILNQRDKIKYRREMFGIPARNESHGKGPHDKRS